MRQLTEAPVPATYTEMTLWVIATLVFVMLGVICYKKIKIPALKWITVLVCVILSLFCALISWCAYIEASGQMIM